MNEEKRNNFLKEESVNILLDRLRHYIETEFAHSATTEELINVCRATVGLLPSLAGDGKGRIVNKQQLLAIICS